MINRFKEGVTFMLQGFKALAHPQVRHYIYIPLLINLVVFGVLFYYCVQYGLGKLSFLTPHLPSWLTWLGGFLSFIKGIIVFALLTILISVFTFFATLGANLVAAPFNGLLSESYSKALGGSVPTQPFLQTIHKTLSRELTKLFYYIPRLLLLGLVVVVLYFIPVANLAIPVLLFWFSAWMMAIQYIDYPADNHQMRFKDVLIRLKEHRSLVLGFGCTVALLSSIPVLNLMVMPAAVLGATRLWEKTNSMKAFPATKIQHPLQQPQ